MMINTSNVCGWLISETIGISIPNPRASARVPRPDGITDEQWDGFVKTLEAFDVVDLPDWFKIGVKAYCVYYTSNPTEVISIDYQKGNWIGEDFDGQHMYPLNEVSKYWKEWYKADE